MRTYPTINLVLVVLSGWFLACGDDPASGNGGNGPAGNRAPVINPLEPQTVDEGQGFEITLAVNDPDGDTLFLEVRELPDDAVFDPVQGTLAYAPDFDVVTAAEGALALPDLIITVDDGYLSASATLSITVVHVNRRPFFLAADGGALNNIEMEVEPALERRFRFQVIDADSDSVTLSLLDSPAFARLDGNALVVAPTEADRGTVAEFGLAANDGADGAELPVRVVVGALDAELPAPTALAQREGASDLAVGATVFEGELDFSSAPHGFEFGPLRLQVEIAPIGTPYEDGDAAIGSPVLATAPSGVTIDVDGGEDYRWRARYLSDEFGAGPYATFGGNTEAEPDLTVSIIPRTVLDEVPSDPSPIDVNFGFFSPNVSDFECSVDGGEWTDCNTRVDCCPGAGCPSPRSVCSREECTCAQRALIGLDPGNHDFSVRGVTRDGLADPDPPGYAWSALDLPVPTVFFTATPTGTVACSTEFQFTSPEPSDRFECRLDPPPPRNPGSFAPCSSPRTVTLTAPGSYTFHVRGVNLVGVAGEAAVHPFVSDCDP